MIFLNRLSLNIREINRRKGLLNWAQILILLAPMKHLTHHLTLSEIFERVSEKKLAKTNRNTRGRSSVWLERLPVTQKVAGSSPVGPASGDCQHVSEVDARRRSSRPALLRDGKSRRPRSLKIFYIRGGKNIPFQREFRYRLSLSDFPFILMKKSNIFKFD